MKTDDQIGAGKVRPERTRRGGMLALIPFLMVVLLAMATMMIDLGYLTCVSSSLQNTADAASLAGVLRLRAGNATVAEVKETAIKFANLNQPDISTVLTPADIEVGMWVPQAGIFVPNSANKNAVRVTVRRDGAQSPRITLYFSKIFGISDRSMKVNSMAAFDFTGQSNGTQTVSRPFILHSY